MSSIKNCEGYVEELNGSNSQEHDENFGIETNQVKDEKTSESLSWWRRTTSLPSSLNKKKNVLFQE